MASKFHLIPKSHNYVNKKLIIHINLRGYFIIITIRIKEEEQMMDKIKDIL